MPEVTREYGVDIHEIGTLDGQVVVAYRVYGKDKGFPLLHGVTWKDEVDALIKEQLQLMLRATDPTAVDLKITRTDEN